MISSTVWDQPESLKMQKSSSLFYLLLLNGLMKTMTHKDTEIHLIVFEDFFPVKWLVFPQIQ